MNKLEIINEALKIPTLPERAFYVGVMAHLDQKDKQGVCYSWHVVRVGLKAKTEDEKIVGFLHDLIEDTDFTYEDLVELDFTQTQINAIFSLTKRKNQTYQDYLLAVSNNDLAYTVKMIDMEDNFRRISQIIDSDLQVRLWEKYTFGLEFLERSYKLRKEHEAKSKIR